MSLRASSAAVLLSIAGAIAPLIAETASPAVGQQAPDFTLTTMRGKTVKLSEAAANGPVVLMVLRGYPGYQCPFCNRQVQGMIQRAQEFADRRVSILAVYPGPPQKLDAKAGEFMADKTMPDNMELLLDPGYEMVKLYGLRWDAPKETAYPATFLIDRERVIFFSKVVKSHGGRTTVAELLEVIPKPKAVQ
jgi:thioredoxin-dependent peroxiredoxin